MNKVPLINRISMAFWSGLLGFGLLSAHFRGNLGIPLDKVFERFAEAPYAVIAFVIFCCTVGFVVADDSLGNFIATCSFLFAMLNALVLLVIHFHTWLVMITTFLVLPFAIILLLEATGKVDYGFTKILRESGITVVVFDDEED